MVHLRDRRLSSYTLDFQFTFAVGVSHHIQLSREHELATKLRAYLKSFARVTRPKKRTSRIQGTLRKMAKASGESAECMSKELADCCTSLDALIKPREKPDEATARQWAEAYVVRYLVLERQSDALLFVQSVLHEALEIDHQSFRFEFLFVPGVKHSIPPHHEEAVPALLKSLLVQLLTAWPSGAPVPNSSELPIELRRMVGAEGEAVREELSACNIALGKLIDPADEPSRDVLLRRAEEFLDDFLIVKPASAKRFMDDSATHALEQIELRRMAKRKAEPAVRKRKRGLLPRSPSSSA